MYKTWKRRNQRKRSKERIEARKRWLNELRNQAFEEWKTNWLMNTNIGQAK